MAGLKFDGELGLFGTEVEEAAAVLFVHHLQRIVAAALRAQTVEHELVGDEGFGGEAGEVDNAGAGDNDGAVSRMPMREPRIVEMLIDKYDREVIGGRQPPQQSLFVPGVKNVGQRDSGCCIDVKSPQS